MGNQFAFLAKAKPATLYRLLEKFPLEDAAIALTGLPHSLALQVLAYYPEERQAPFLPAMREARGAAEEQRHRVAEKIHLVIAEAKASQAGSPGLDTPANTPSDARQSAPQNPSPTPSPATRPALPHKSPPNPAENPSPAAVQNPPAFAAPPAKPPLPGASIPIASMSKSLAEKLPLPGRKTPEAISEPPRVESVRPDTRPAPEFSPAGTSFPAAANPYRQQAPASIPDDPGVESAAHLPANQPVNMPGNPGAKPGPAPAGRSPAGPIRQGLRGGGAAPGMPAKPGAAAGQSGANGGGGKQTPYPAATFAEMAPTSSVLSGPPPPSPAPPPSSPPAGDPPKAGSGLSGLGGKLKEVLKQAHAEISKGLIANSSVAKQAAEQTPNQSAPAGKSPPPPARPGQRPAAPPPADGQRPRRPEGPTQWIPRAATASPINGPPLPGRPESASGDPLKSPLAAELLQRIGQAQAKFLPGKKDGAAANRPPAVIGGGLEGGGGRKPPGQPGQRVVGPVRGMPPVDRRKPEDPLEPREGVVGAGKVEMSRTPRMIGQGAKRLREMPGAGRAGGGPAGGEPRRMDGKAILAAILREADSEVRDTVRLDDPGLFRELRGRMFFFDDLLLTDDQALAQVFTAAKVEDGALAIRFAAPRLRDRVLRVVSPGRARALKDSAPPRAGVDDIEAAQKRVLGVALRLQSVGRILIDPKDPDLAGE